MITPSPAMWVRIAIHLHRIYCLELNKVTEPNEYKLISPAIVDKSYKIVESLMCDANREEVGNWYRPRFFFCLNCGHVDKPTTIIRHQFHAACTNCIDTHPIKERDTVVSSWVNTPWYSLTRNLLLYAGAVKEIDEYLENIMLTGLNPFDILIQQIQRELL